MVLKYIQMSYLIFVQIDGPEMNANQMFIQTVHFLHLFHQSTNLYLLLNYHLEVVWIYC